MLFAEFNERGEFVRPRDLPDAQTARWVDGKRVATEPEDVEMKAVWSESLPVFRPLVLVETPLDPCNYKPNGYEYRLEADGTVSRIELVQALTTEEKEAVALRNAKQTRCGSIPEPDEVTELFASILKIILDRQLMTEVTGDPRTRVSISQEGYDELKHILRTLRATPLPGKGPIDARKGSIKADIEAPSARDTQITIFNDLVEQMQGVKGVPLTVQNAFNQLRKLIA